MANKLKDIFSNKMVDMGGKIRFETPDAYKKFLEALEIVWEEGKAVEIEGVTSISTQMKTGKYVYPFLEDNKVDKVFIAPSTERVPITLETELGERTLQLRRYYTSNEIILETDSKAIVYMKMKVRKGTTENTFSYRVQPDFAKNIDEIVENYIITIAFIDYLFREDLKSTKEELDMISKTKSYFSGALDFYKRLQNVEKEFELQFNPKLKNEKGNDEQEFEELYYLLYEKKVFRYNAKLTADSGINVAIKLNETKLEIGSKLELTFKSKVEFDIYGQTISIFTANLLSNAVVKEIKEEENGNVKIWYDDTDSEPMYISYTGFRTETERDCELETIKEHPQKYIEALTVEDFLRQKEFYRANQVSE